ncbi:MAG: hypothetical protein IJV06_08045 [Bacteroidaceae bacterium]|nr:hypothetical protein [Bacteroidaceae bacterium]
MKKKFTLFKTLLVAAGLLGGSSAWAATHYILNETFNSQPNVWNKAVDGVTYVKYTEEGSDYYVYQTGRSSGHNAIWYAPTRDWNDDINEYTVEFDFKTSVNGSYLTSEIALYDANSSVSGRMDTNGFNTTAANGTTNNIFFASSTAVADGVTTYTIYGKDKTFTMAAGTWYHFSLTINKTTKAVSYTITADGKDAQSGSYTSTSTTGICTGVFIRTPRSGNISFDNFFMTDEVENDVAAVPVISLTALNGTERTYTITCLPGETLHYVLPGESESASSSSASTVVSTSTSGTLRAWTTSGTAISTEATVDVDASAVTLAAPEIWISGMSTNGSLYNAELNARNDQNSVLLKPTATMSATFTPDGDVAENVTLPYTATEKGTLTVTVSAEGYTSASTSFSVEGNYVQTWQSLDFSSLVGTDAVQAALGTDWTLQDGHGRWASWNKDKDGSYNFYATSTDGKYKNFNENIYFRDVVVLAEGMGLGRNVTGGEAISVSNTVAGQIVAFEIYNGYGVDINKGTNTYMSYAMSNGTDRPSMSSTNGALLVQATIYSPVPTTVSKSISDAGYATYCSPYALDFTGSGLTAYVATVTGTEVSFTEVTKVPANTGVLLKGAADDYEITVAASADAVESALIGVTEETKVPAGSFVLYNGDKGVGFYKTTAEFTVGANTAYLPALGGDAKARFISLDEGTATAITAVEAVTNNNGVIYNLRGQRVAQPTKGIYIQNGKKILVK